MPSSPIFRVWILIFSAALAPAAAGQRGGTSSNASRPTSPSRTPSTPDPSLQPVFVSGKVLLEGGGVLPEPVAIERVCNGVSRREGYTDFKGLFEFQVGVNMTFQDASESDSRTSPNAQSHSTPGLARRGGTDLNGCEIKAL